jgi:vitamin B12 transporter
MKKFISHILLLHVYAIAIGQSSDDTTLRKNSIENIKTLVEVNVLHPKFNVGTNTDTCSKFNQLVFSGRFLADVLTSFGNAYLKQTAPGQLATISLNGGNTSQTQVTWQGINLNNPATGQTDFSLVPVALFNEISILNGSTGASGGSGSVAGSVILNNNLNAKENSWNTFGGIHYGSFGRYSTNAGFTINKNRISFSTHLFYVDFKNNFNYTDSWGTEKTMEHAKVNAFGGLSSLSYKSKRGVLTASGWYQQNKREIPPTLGQSISLAKLDDALTRIVFNYTPYNNTPFLNLTLAYLSDAITYYSGYNNEVSYAKLNSITTESKTQFVFRNVNNLIKLNASVFYGENNGYKKNEVMTRLGASYFLQEEVEFFERLSYHWSLSFREELNQQEFSIPIVQGGIELKTKFKSKKFSTNFFQLKLNGGTVYRFPTMNDLFWSPGGNPNLKSERGGSANVGLHYQLSKEKAFLIHAEVNHFERYLFNMIVWQPSGSFWTPQNLMEVWSRGNETRIYVELFDKIKFSIDASLCYTVSTTQKTAIVNDASLGMQLIYVPLYSSRVETGIQFSKCKLSYIYSYYGYRYTSSDNYEYLPPFSNHDVRLAFFIGKSTFQTNFYIEGANLLNAQYSWIAQRPALPRNFNIGLQFKFGNKLKVKPTANSHHQLIYK